MKRVILPITAVAAIALSAPSFAVQTQASTQMLSAQVKHLNAETKELQHEVLLLKKHKHGTAKKSVRSSHNVVVKGHALPWDHFVTVTTTPFLGRRTDFDGDDLLVNVSSNNEDLRLLKQKQQIENNMTSQGHSLDRPILQVSGAVEGEGFSQSGFGTGTVNGVNLSTAELNLNAMASSWATAFMALDYNGAPISTGNREPNSTIFLSRGFATIGNLNRFPVYFTGGLMYVPFGRYANGMVSTPLTVSLGKIRTPAALLGFSLDNGLHGSVYGYSGSQTSGGQSMFKQWGLDAAYKHKFAQADHFTLGAGWVSNIADSEGMQSNGLATGTTATQFNGFANTTSTSSNNNALVHSVDGFDGHAALAMGPVSLVGEYLGAAERFNVADLSYNSVGAQPRVMHAEVDYSLPFIAKKYGTSVGFAYGHTWQALALNLPEDSYSVFVNASIWRETIESLEFRHDTDYASTAIASGRGATTNILGTGRSRDSVLAQVGVYF